MAEDIKSNNLPQGVKNREITEEVQQSYLEYAMSVIVSRALPDVRDGLKPVHRRILYSMHEVGLRSTAKYRKSATVVGDTMGKYHPHGDVAIYDTMARMAQDFSLRYPLVDGQGNFGSIDGDSPAAMRYTEARLDPIADQLLADIEKDTVNFRDNYDGSRQEPSVMPTRIPNLLINGSMGIAVGMATNIPPHNLSEVLDGLVHLIDNPEADLKELMQFVKGPDFPTGATIYNEQDIVNAYATGRGPVVMRGKAEIVEGKRGFQIIISEIPYQVNKAELIIKIADLVKEKRIDGIKDLRDESDKDGMRIAVDLKQDAFPRKVLNQLYKYTELQKSFHFNMLALVDGIQPQILGLKGLLEKFIDHRRDVVIRRSKFELQKAKDRAHILEGLKKALDHIDEIIKIIRASQSKEDAAANLIKRFKFSDRQAAAILDMRLQALAGLERKKVEDELAEKLAIIAYLEDLLKSPKKILGVVKSEFKEIREKHGDERRTKVVKSALREIGEEELIPEEDSLFMLTKDGYIKRMAPDVLKAQKRGGKGLIGMATKEEDVISHFFLANTHDNILFFTNSGKVFQTKGYEVPESSRQSKGKAIVNFLQVSPNDLITAIVPIPKGQKRMYLFMATEHGVIKKVEMDAFEQVRRNGMIAIKLNGGDRLGWVLPTSGDDQISLVTSDGNAIRFKEKDVRPMGRGAAGVIGIRLEDKAHVVGADVIPSGSEKGLYLLALMENGYGKRSDLKSYKVQKRGGHGIMTAKLTPKTGPLVSAHVTSEENKDIIAVSRKGQVIKTTIESISILGRATQGVRVMRLEAGDKLASVVIA
jgi:DNA gyrase subunit A